MGNKVKFGLSNVHVFPVTKEEQGKVTYGEAIAVSGAVNLSLKAEGSSDPFYADNIAYYVVSSNNGYTGTLEVALLPEEFEVKILGHTKHTETGNIIEKATDKNVDFALAFQFEGDANATRHIIYRCTAKRPALEGETVSDKVNPKTESLEFTATPRADGVIKARCEKGSSAYDRFFEAPWESGTPGV